MSNKNYIRGRAGEYKVMRHLESLGFETARTAGSHGKFDVFGIRKLPNPKNPSEPINHIIFIQVKRYKGRKKSEKIMSSYRAYVREELWNV